MIIFLGAAIDTLTRFLTLLTLARTLTFTRALSTKYEPMYFFVPKNDLASKHRVNVHIFGAIGLSKYDGMLKSVLVCFNSSPLFLCSI